MSPIQASSKRNEEYVYQNLLDQRKKTKPKFKFQDLSRVADLRKIFSRGGTNNWSYKLYKITEIDKDTIPIFCADNIPELYKEVLMETTQLTMKEIDSVKKKLSIGWIK